jgi:hypothetical protein
LEKGDKSKIVIFIIAIIIPFGVVVLLAYYTIRYFIFRKPFIQELNLIKRLIKKWAKK